MATVLTTRYIHSRVERAFFSSFMASLPCLRARAVECLSYHV